MVSDSIKNLEKEQQKISDAKLAQDKVEAFKTETKSSIKEFLITYWTPLDSVPFGIPVPTIYGWCLIGVIYFIYKGNK